MPEQRIKEEWKSISGFDSYEVSNKGRIRRIQRTVFVEKTQKKMNLKQRIMKQRWNKPCKIYFLDLLNNDGKRKTVYPHKEVARAFAVNPNPEKNTMIIHIDNNSKNNHANNLQWATPSDHMAFQFKVGNKNNFKVWKTRKKKYKNGFKGEEEQDYKLKAV